MAFLPGGNTSHLITVIVTSTSSANSGIEKTAESLMERLIVTVRQDVTGKNVILQLGQIVQGHRKKVKLTEDSSLFLSNYIRNIQFVNNR